MLSRPRRLLLPACPRSTCFGELPSRNRSRKSCCCGNLCDCYGCLLLPVTLLIVAWPDKLAAFPASLSGCQTPTGWNCSGYDDRENDLFLCDTKTCKFDRECLRIGDTVTCVCHFKGRRWISHSFDFVIVGYDDRENDLFLCDTKTCKFDRECLRIGDTVTCVCHFKGRRWISHS
ncbi:hypothetical protein E2320_022755, partial [Naja naja]